MSVSHPWYHIAFTEHYSRFAEHQLSAEQVSAEVAYLQKTLAQAPGRRVVDLGCGVGRYTIPLGLAGFEMTGLDLSTWALEEATHRSKQANVTIRWEQADLLAATEWPLGQIDVAICIDSFGWGSDADQLNFLRRLRRHLAPNGVLVLVCPNAFQTSSQETSATIDETTYLSRQEFDQIHSRRQDSLTVTAPGRSEQSFHSDLRVYTPVELATLVRKGGFVVERVTSGSASGWTPSIELVARAIPAPPVALAVATWGAPTAPRLDLRYNPDETDWLNPSPTSIWNELIADEGEQGVSAIGVYPVDDPYGAERGAPAVAAFLGCPVAPPQVTFAAGVTSLLHDLCGLANDGLIVTPQLIHPDLTTWALAHGSEVCFVEEPATVERLVATIQARRPSLVSLDRPSFVGELIDFAAVQAIAEAAAQVGAAVVIDESPATYLGPANSAASVVNRVDNLVVLRSVTKGYSWGGMRAGFALASHGLSARVRELVAPMQVGELSFRALLRLLMAGDIFQKLRTRFHTTKPSTTALLRACGFEVIEGHPDLGWVVLPNTAGKTSRQLERVGVQGLHFVPSPALRPPYPELLHLTVPLLNERMAELSRRLEELAEAGHPAAFQLPHI